ncbi:hypothetical protein [Lewinella sp. LCG006]|uniref:hypothetical protein n=1 Tax=Lewinella sp. LCG006 TaxID=3231911 RepID=UPI00345F79CC
MKKNELRYLQKLPSSKPKFPAIDLTMLSDTNWSNDLHLDYSLLTGEFIFSRKSELLIGHKVVDSKGDIYTVEELYFFSNWLSYLPLTKKGVIKFNKEEEHMKLDELKVFFLEKLNNDEVMSITKASWIRSINKAKTFEELFLGE